MAISSLEFRFVQRLVALRSGVVLAEKDKYLIEARLVPLARQQQISSVSELIRKAQSPVGGDLPELILDCLLPKDTAFFRDPLTFDFLKSEVFKVLEMKRYREARLRIWSAGCSSGQEAYSVAMLLHRYYSPLLDWDVEILATDLSGEALGKAREGRFDEIEVHRGIQPTLIREFFTQNGPHYTVNERVAKLVRFERWNLIEEWPALPSVDVVLLRNVLRYMTSESKRAVLARLRNVLKADGYLFVGAQETLPDGDGGYRMVPAEKTVYFQPSHPGGGA